MIQQPVFYVPPRREFMILDRWMVGEDQLRAVELADVTDFMARHGWVPLPHARPHCSAYSHPELLDDSGKPLRQYIVWGEKDLRHLDTVARLLVSLSICHDTTPELILSELAANAPAPAGV